MRTAVPLLSAQDVTARHLVSLTLDSVDYVLWRSASGDVICWEDHCCHRGVKLSIGRNLGSEVKCRYHGWTFASDGACTSIPAQPERRPPATARAIAHDCSEKYGLIWLTRSGLPKISQLEDNKVTPLRSVMIHAPADVVRDELCKRYPAEAYGEHWFVSSRIVDDKRTSLLIAISPHTSQRATVHSVACGIFSGEQWLQLARSHNDDLKGVRAYLETRGRKDVAEVLY